MKDALDELDKAVSGGGTSSSFAEEYPDAPAWAIDLAEATEENAARLDRKQKAQKTRKMRVKNTLVEAVEETAKRADALARAAGMVADGTDNSGAEKGLASDNLNERQKFFIPKGELDYHQ